MIEDALYQLSDRDLSGPLLTPFALQVTTVLGAPNAAIDCNFPPALFPPDKIIILETVGFVLTAAAATEVQSAYLSWLPTPALAVIITGEIFSLAGLVGVTKGWGKNIRKVLPPQPSMIMTARMSAAGLHAMTASITGYTIPRGNISGV